MGVGGFAGGKGDGVFAGWATGTGAAGLVPVIDSVIAAVTALVVESVVDAVSEELPSEVFATVFAVVLEVIVAAVTAVPGGSGGGAEVAELAGEEELLGRGHAPKANGRMTRTSNHLSFI